MMLSNYLQEQGFEHIDSQFTSYLYTNKHQTIAVIVDTQLYSGAKPDYRYHEYTWWQNKLMHKFDRLYRFIDNDKQQDKVLVDAFLYDKTDEHDFRQFGADRQVTETDPTRPEYNFESLFERVYGSMRLSANINM